MPIKIHQLYLYIHFILASPPALGSAFSCMCSVHNNGHLIPHFIGINIILSHQSLMKVKKKSLENLWCFHILNVSLCLDRSIYCFWFKKNHELTSVKKISIYCSTRISSYIMQSAEVSVSK